MRGVRAWGPALLVGWVGVVLLLSPGVGGPAAGVEVRFRQSFEREFARGPADAIQTWTSGTDLELEGFGLRLSGSWLRRERRYRERPYLDRVWTTRFVGVEFPLGGISNALTLWQRDARYPQNPSRDYDARRQTVRTELRLPALRVEGELTRANWCLPYSTERKRGGDARRLDLAVAGRQGAVEAGGSLFWLACSYAQDPERDEVRRAFEFTWALGLPSGTVEWEVGSRARRFPSDPERDEVVWERRLEASFAPLAGLGRVTLLGRAEDTDRPNRPQLTKRFRRLRGAVERDLRSGTLSFRLTYDLTFYPNDLQRTRSVREARVRVETELFPWVLRASFEHEITSFPRDPVRDKRFVRWGWEWTRSQKSGSIALAGEMRDTRYPNDPVRDVREIRTGFDVETEPLPDLTISLAGTWSTQRFPHDPARSTTTTTLFLNLELKLEF